VRLFVVGGWLLAVGQAGVCGLTSLIAFLSSLNPGSYSVQDSLLGGRYLRRGLLGTLLRGQRIQVRGTPNALNPG
jgi:hypothetical protein